jgi:DNA-binding response OmpR family regulator
MRVLVIEDNGAFRGLTLRWLHSYGIEAEGATNGAEGLAMQRARPADVIVTDIFMPEMEGIETIHDLRREFPEAKIIAMSGRDPLMKFDVFEVAREVGAARTFKKPFRFEELVAAVYSLANQQNQASAATPEASQAASRPHAPNSSPGSSSRRFQANSDVSLGARGSSATPE